ncbi:unnamed protein product [Polarella glacialis]|uniref:DEK-C domain-containing protein n=1 Tax=Polarella glacialis TaxID=89957 RepID=A0A813GG42_POLGL|nr:unnamed protein product [Polarella glacialis]CAE8687568.1 unnamed protein product [Polarella glacialis]
MASRIVEIDDSDADELTELSSAELQDAILALLEGRDLTSISLGELRHELEKLLSLSQGALTPRKGEIKLVAARCVQDLLRKRQPQPEAPQQPHQPSMLDSLPSRGKRSFPAVAASSASATPPPPKKKGKHQQSAFSAFFKAVSPQVQAEIGQDVRSNQGFGAVAKEIAGRWKVMAPEDKACYTPPPDLSHLDPTTPAGPRSGGGGAASIVTPAPTRRLPPISSAPPYRPEASCSGPLTRQQFVAADKLLAFRLEEGAAGLQEDLKSSASTLANLSLHPRTFSTKSCGWYANSNVVVTVAGKQVEARMQMTITINGSKFWAEGVAPEEASKTETMEKSDSQIRELLKPEESQGLQEPQDLQEPQGPQEPQQPQGPQELQEPPVHQEPRELQKSEELQELQEPAGPQKSEELQGPQEAAGPQKNEDLQEPREPQELQGPQELPVTQEPQEPQKFEELQEPQEPAGLQKSEELQEPAGLQKLEELQEDPQEHLQNQAAQQIPSPEPQDQLRHELRQDQQVAPDQEQEQEQEKPAMEVQESEQAAEAPDQAQQDVHQDGGDERMSQSQEVNEPQPTQQQGQQQQLQEDNHQLQDSAMIPAVAEEMVGEASGAPHGSFEGPLAGPPVAGEVVASCHVVEPSTDSTT